ncbi:FKBP-type peptidyl-prolyl cis-trans isomerase [Thalassotalea sediminis]|uniref:FKBP-type peptidyl-prolyl cis-trans isomerase n=1 Tax=Thalassotalea sediminis TaxID=1759089 RepID=UPI0025738834|nr:FKBP-type peptidyl-prolyl cis-trans isomerase [Thalassotalea sediminis]
MKLFKPTVVALALISVVGCQQETKKEEAPVLDTEVQKQAYALGASIGMFTQRNLEQQETLGLSLDQALILRGIKDSLEGKAVIEKEEVQALMMNLEKSMREKQQAVAAKEASEALEKGQAYLAENAKKDGVVVTESGLQYQVVEAGEGEKPTATDIVKVHYQGTLMDGTEFDSSYKRNEPIEFPLNGVIPGWTEGVQLMSKGAKYNFTIPSDLAYGPSGRPPQIPANAVLNFVVELIDFKTAEEAAAEKATKAESEDGHAH